MKEKIHTKNLSTQLIAFETYFELHKQIYKGLDYLELKNVLQLFEISIEDLRNILKEEAERFPSDFVFLIEDKNKKELAFTLSGLLMLAGQLRTERANKISVQLIEYLVSQKPNIGFDLIMSKEIK